MSVHNHDVFSSSTLARALSLQGRENPLISAIERTSAQKSNETKSRIMRSSGKITIGERIEATTTKILLKLDEFNAINAKLKKDNVPSIVVGNLNQTLKDIEVGGLFSIN